MGSNEWKERMVETTVTYTLQKGDRFYRIENVPARVDVNTGEQYFAPQTVEWLEVLMCQDGICSEQRETE